MAKVVKSTREIVNVDEELKKIKGKEKSKEKKVNKKSTKTTKDSKKKKVSSKKRKGIRKFFHEVRSEVSKVKWPNKKDMGKYSLATIIFILFFALFFYVIELVLALLKMGV